MIFSDKVVSLRFVNWMHMPIIRIQTIKADEYLEFSCQIWNFRSLISKICSKYKTSIMLDQVQSSFY